MKDGSMLALGLGVEVCTPSLRQLKECWKMIYQLLLLRAGMDQNKET